VPVEDIYTFLRSLIRCCVLYSFFAPGESLTNAIMLLEVWKLVGNFSLVNLAGFRRNSRKAQNPQLQLQLARIPLYASYLFFKNKFIPCCDDERCESVENLGKPLRRQPVVTEALCAFNVCISDISGKLVAEQACGIFHPQVPTAYPLYFRPFFTVVIPIIIFSFAQPVNKIILAYLTPTSLLFD
jgi:hypothetical protein